MPEVFSVSAITGIRFCWSAREANSGTTPPYFSCTDCVATILLSTLPLDIIEAEVSSHEDSISQDIYFHLSTLKQKFQFSQIFKSRIFKTIMAVILSLLTILLALVLLISLPPVQTRIIQVATSYLNKDSDFTVKIGYINISWFDAVYLKDLSVTDPLDSTMISTQRLHVDVSIIDLIRSNRFRLDAVNLENTKIQLIKPDSTSGLNINTWIAELNERFGSEEPVDTTAAAVFGIGRIRLKNGVFAMYDLTQAPLEDGFDYQNFQLDNVNLSLQNFHSEGDSLAFNVLQLEAYDDVSGLEVNRLETAFRMNAQLMHFDELDLSLNESRIGESIRLNYDSIDDLSDFIDKVQIQAILTHTYLDTRDLALFAPALADYTDIYKISGEFDGTISDFKINNLAALLGENSLLKGTLSMQGLPDINATFIQASLNNSVLDMRDLQTYLPIDAYQTARKFGMVNLTSEFIGYTNDFVANGRFRTALGNIRTDINLKLPQNQDNISYNGSLYLRNFQLGKLLDQEETIQQISFDGLVKGQGIDPEKAVIELDAKIAKLGVLGYDYQDIIAEGKLAQGLFEGSLDINDPNLKFTALGNVNLAADQELINISASLDTAFFQELNLTDQELFFSSKMVLNTTGFDIDNLTGEAYFTDNYLYLNGRGLEIQNFDFASTQTNRNRKITLSSELLNGEISGDFLFTQFVKDLKQLLEDYRRILVSEAQVPADSLNSSSASKTSNKQTSINSKNLGTKANEPKDSLSNYTITYNFDLTDVSPLVHLLEPSFYASKNINLSGEFINGENTIFNIFTEFDSLFFKNNWFFDNTLDFNTAKVRNTSNILAMGFVESKKQKISNSIDTDNLFVEALWDDDHIDFSIGIEQLASDNKLLFEGELDIMTDRTEITFKPSEIRVLERKWEFTPNNLITISDGEFGFFDFKISNQNQAISLEGFLSSDPEKEFIFKLDQFEADNINPVTLQSYEGLITSKIIISDPFNDLKVSGDLQTEEFRINSLLVGDITASAKWNNNEDEMDVSLVNNRRNIKTVDINGSIAFNNETQNFDLTARFDEAVLNVAEPFLQDYISNIRGTASGSFRILGTFDFPNITGNGEVKGAQMKVNYLGTTYNFDGGLVFTDNEIGFRRLALKDNENNTAFISGGVFHDGFSNFVLDISGNLNKFKLLNTTARDNELFYGTAVATGNISVLGAANNLTINAKAKTETGTRIFIPIGGTSEQKTEDFIKIVNKLDTSRTVTFTEEVEKLDITGLKMNFDLEITPDAYTEIIIDPRTGDIIRGRGNGDIKLEIDSKGDFQNDWRLYSHRGILQFYTRRWDHHQRIYHRARRKNLLVWRSYGGDAQSPRLLQKSSLPSHPMTRP